MRSVEKIKTKPSPSSFPKFVEGKKTHLPETNGIRVIEEEERMVREAFSKRINGVNYRTVSFIFFKEHLEVSLEDLLNHHTVILTSFLRSVINPKNKFDNYRNGKLATSETIKNFRKEFNVILGNGSVIRKKLSEGDILSINCYFGLRTGDVNSFESCLGLIAYWGIMDHSNNKTLFKSVC